MRRATVLVARSRYDVDCGTAHGRPALPHVGEKGQPANALRGHRLAPERIPAEIEAGANRRKVRW